MNCLFSETACLVILTPLSFNSFLKKRLISIDVVFLLLHNGYLIIDSKLNFPFRVKATSLNTYFRSTKLLKFPNSYETKPLKNIPKTTPI